jgi:hypothetical protein
MNERKALSVSVDLGSMNYLCMDVYCACGKHSHVDVYRSMNRTAENVRCPHCQRVYRLEPQTALQREKVDFGLRIEQPHTFVQWKGTELHGTAHCDCGTDNVIHRDFAYEVDCGGCASHFHVNPHLLLTELSAEEAAALEEKTVATAEGDDDEQDGSLSVPVLANYGLGSNHEDRVARFLGADVGARRPTGVVILPDLHVASIGSGQLEAMRALMSRSLELGTIVVGGGDSVYDRSAYPPELGTLVLKGDLSDEYRKDLSFAELDRRPFVLNLPPANRKGRRANRRKNKKR